MTSIFGSTLWLLSVLQRLSSWRKPARDSALAPSPRTGTALLASSGNWRPLTSTSSGPGARYLVRRTADTNLYSIYIRDTRTTLTWRCDFYTQHERNTYLNQLRSGTADLVPQILVHPDHALR